MIKQKMTKIVWLVVIVVCIFLFRYSLNRYLWYSDIDNKILFEGDAKVLTSEIVKSKSLYGEVNDSFRCLVAIKFPLLEETDVILLVKL